ncbi:MAG: hypothetical protein ACJ77K_14060 [Bacteroidia bacterium]
MAKNIVQKAEEEILKGRTHQEIYNEIAYHTEHPIHQIADHIRKIVTPAKRKKYSLLNYLLLFLLVCTFSINAGSLIGAGFEIFPITAVPLCVFLVYLCLKYRPDGHLITGGFMAISFVRNIFYFNPDSKAVFIGFLFITITAAGIAFFLAWKLPADYRMEKELLKENPDQRVDALTFMD